ncbi:MAG: ribonuclease Y [Parachlamydiales bacterium]|jgi:ribonuclease Y
MDANTIALILVIFIFGIILGITLWGLNYRFRKGGFQRLANDILTKANQEAESLRKSNELTIKQSHLDQQKEVEQVWQQERKKLTREEERLKQREDKLEGRLNTVEKKLIDLEKREITLAAQREQILEDQKLLQTQKENLLIELEKAAGLSATEARELLLEKINNDVRTETAHMIRRATKEAEENAEDLARKIIVTSINRLAVSTVSDATVNIVSIPSEEMKGRIIGREGRNIRTLERATGVNFIIDDTPNAVVISGFDPLRLHIAKQCLAELVADGRIHPTRIEEIVEKVQKDVQKKLRQHGEDAALRAGAINLHPEIILLLGKLKLRYSFGQNILDHSIEVAHIMGLFAGELGLDIKLAKRIGLLHDIGKAVSHEVEGSHALIGHDIVLKYGESIDVATGVGCHHFEMPANTIEGSLCSAADALSASRPGGRIEAVEEYIKRLKRLEEIAEAHPCVEKAYALQAGREIRVIVQPDAIDDDGVITLARDLTKQIERELTYPGKIKVTVIRERRAVEYAL